MSNFIDAVANIQTSADSISNNLSSSIEYVRQSVTHVTELGATMMTSLGTILQNGREAFQSTISSSSNLNAIPIDALCLTVAITGLAVGGSYLLYQSYVARNPHD